MNVCIVTVYNSINVGSYWQARALGEVLEKIGHNVVYYRNPERIRILFSEIKRGISLIYHRKIKEGIRYFASILMFLKEQQIFQVVRKSEGLLKNIDCVIFGSDTIWNLNDKYFNRDQSTFWGLEFDEERLCSYAASISNTEPDIILQNDKYKKALERFYNISVRDIKTKTTVELLGGFNVELVCDPTLLLRKKSYVKITKCKRQINDKKYILVYLFTPLNKQQEKELIRFAKEKKLLIVSAYGKKNVPYADKVLIDNPQSFMRYFLGADYVVTDTFHGTIFSINFHKKFCSIDRGKMPVNNAMYEYNLTNWLISEEGSLFNQLDATIPTEMVEKIIQTNRKKSIKFLLSCFNYQ